MLKRSIKPLSPSMTNLKRLLSRFYIWISGCHHAEDSSIQRVIGSMRLFLLFLWGGDETPLGDSLKTIVKHNQIR